MKKFKAWKSYCAFTVLLCGFLITGCGGGDGGGGTWDAPTPIEAVSSTVPVDGATGVPIGNKLTVTFSEEMNPATINTTTFTVQKTGPPLGTKIGGVITYSGLVAVFDPDVNLDPSTEYTATITTGAKNLAGNPLADDYSWSFTTGATIDTTKPRVTLTVPVDTAPAVATNTKITATFTEDMNPLTFTGTTFTVVNTTAGGTDVDGNVTYAVAARTATFTPTTPTTLPVLSLFTATIKSTVEDLAGNQLAGNQAALPAASDYVWTFTTGAGPDTTAPTVTLTNPADLGTGVALNSTVNATFSEEMDPLTISIATFTVQKSGPPLGSNLVGTVAYDLLTDIAKFTPKDPLDPSTEYTATVTSGAKDLAGNALVVPAVGGLPKPNPWTFTTGTGLAPGAIALNSASGFGIMATSAITNTGAGTMINGDVSLDPGTSCGLLPAQVNGDIHINDSVSAQARVDLLSAYNEAKTLPPGTTISAGADLGALYPLGIPPGTYTSGSTMLVSTPLILDAGGNADAVWVFQIGSSLTTGASLSLANGAQEKNVFWVPTLDATIGVGTIFYGTIVSGRDVTGMTGTVINGRILAGATTAGTIALDTNTVNVPAP